jgi:hypothetical protein
MTADSPAFETSRLRVFEVAVKPTNIHSVRRLFVAFRLDDESPGVAATVLMWDAAQSGSHLPWVDWLETSTSCRRDGIATELVEGIERHLGAQLDLSPVTAEGGAFCEHMKRLRKRRGR